jgi:thioredoxin-like negative regulator of GroEL
VAARFGIHSIPTVLFVKDGRIVDQVVGAVPKAELQRRLDTLGYPARALSQDGSGLFNRDAGEPDQEGRGHHGARLAHPGAR